MAHGGGGRRPWSGRQSAPSSGEAATPAAGENANLCLFSDQRLRLVCARADADARPRRPCVALCASRAELVLVHHGGGSVHTSAPGIVSAFTPVSDGVSECVSECPLFLWRLRISMRACAIQGSDQQEQDGISLPCAPQCMPGHAVMSEQHEDHTGTRRRRFLIVMLVPEASPAKHQTCTNHVKDQAQNHNLDDTQGIELG